MFSSISAEPIKDISKKKQTEMVKNTSRKQCEIIT